VKFANPAAVITALLHNERVEYTWFLDILLAVLIDVTYLDSLHNKSEPYDPFNKDKERHQDIWSKAYTGPHEPFQSAIHFESNARSW
jgi:hypothetical protein